MSEQFDPYHKWLGISPEHRPPTLYQLLGIANFESDVDVIATAADGRMAHVRKLQNSRQSELSQKLLNELATARVCLLKPEKKAAYDQKLRAKLTPPAGAAPPRLPAAAPVAKRPQAASPTPVEESGPFPAYVPRPRTKQTAKGKSSQFKIVAAIVAVLVVGGGAAIAWQLTRDGEKSAVAGNGSNHNSTANGNGAQTHQPHTLGNPAVAPPKEDEHLAFSNGVREIRKTLRHADRSQTAAAIKRLRDSLTFAPYQEEVARLEFLNNGLQTFEAAFEACWKSLKSGETLMLERDKRQLTIIAFRGDAVTVLDSNQQLIYDRHALPPQLVEAIVRRSTMPINDLETGLLAYHTVHTFGDRSTAHQLYGKLRTLATIPRDLPNEIGKYPSAPPAPPITVVAQATPTPGTPTGSRPGEPPIRQFPKPTNPFDPDVRPETPPTPPSTEVAVVPQPPENVEPATPVKRLAPPDAAQQEKARELIREIFKDDLAKAKGRDEKLALAKSLVEKASSTKDDAAACYVLLITARDLAAGIADGTMLHKAVDSLSEQYEVKPLELIAEAFTKAIDATTTAALSKELGDLVLATVDDAVADGEYQGAEKLLTVATAASRKSRDANLTKHVAAVRKELTAYVKAQESADAAAETLKTSPQDPAASLALGSYLCFTRGDWERGLTHLEKGSDEPLAAVAKADTAGADDGNARVEVGDKWWALAEQEKDAVRKAAFRKRAGHWYEQAASQVAGLTEAKVKRRVKELEDAAAAEAAAKEKTVGSGRPTRSKKPPEVYVIGAWGARRGAADFKVQVAITDRPVILVCTGIRDVNWTIEAAPKAEVRAIIISGSGTQTVKASPPKVPVKTYHRDNGTDAFYATDANSEQYRNLEYQVQKITGQKVTNFQGYYDVPRAPVVITAKQ